MPSLQNLRLMFVVAKRELTSILRGKAERFLFIWTSLLGMPLITLAALTIFLLLRTTDILSPVRIAVAPEFASMPAVQRMISDLHDAPDIVVRVVSEPDRALAANECDAVIEPDFAQHTMKLTSNNFIVERVASRALDSSRRRAIANMFPEIQGGSVFAYNVRAESIERYESAEQGVRLFLVGLCVVAFLYSVVWLVPAVDVVRFDFLHNNIYANLALPVPMRVVTGGKLLSGIVITLLPTVLSGLAFLFSLSLAVVVLAQYYGLTTGGGAVFPEVFGRQAAVPLGQLAALPILLAAAIAFLHAWLTMVVVYFQGQRLSFSISLFTLLMWAQCELLFGIGVPANGLAVNAIPFFGLAACVRQMYMGTLNIAGVTLSVVSTLIVTYLLVCAAGRFYALESFRARSRSLRNLRLGVKS